MPGGSPIRCKPTLTPQIQRNFTYATNDVREAYVQIKNALYNDKINKVVFILHSQGGIEGSLIIDWLLAEGTSLPPTSTRC